VKCQVFFWSCRTHSKFVHKIYWKYCIFPKSWQI
jgi:hypothetical protein